MTANHAHTPTTDLVSSVYVQHMTRHGDVSVRQVKDGFDRFIAAAEQRGADRVEQAVRKRHTPDADGICRACLCYWHPCPTISDVLDVTDEYRADQMEGDGA